MLKTLMYLVMLLIGIPVGYLLSNLCKDEIKSWKIRLSIMSLISLIASILVYFSNFQLKIPVILTLIFIIIVCLTIIIKNYSK